MFLVFILYNFISVNGKFCSISFNYNKLDSLLTCQHREDYSALNLLLHISVLLLLQFLFSLREELLDRNPDKHTLAIKQSLFVDVC